MTAAKKGDPYLRTLLVKRGTAHFGTVRCRLPSQALGIKVAGRGGRNGKKRAIVATARKLAVLLHHLWVSGEVYELLHNSRRVTVAAAA